MAVPTVLPTCGERAHYRVLAALATPPRCRLQTRGHIVLVLRLGPKRCLRVVTELGSEQRMAGSCASWVVPPTVSYSFPLKLRNEVAAVFPEPDEFQWRTGKRETCEGDGVLWS